MLKNSFLVYLCIVRVCKCVNCHSKDTFMNVNVILFPTFETLDVFGPVEIFGRLDSITIRYFSLMGGLISNDDAIQIMTEPISALQSDNAKSVLFVPGGMGTRKEVDNMVLMEAISYHGAHSKYVLSVCTGSALLAKAQLLSGKRATSNKRALEWAMSINESVKWLPKARWVVDGKFYTSSGVSAGMDMALGFVADVFGLKEAEKIAFEIEYVWNKNKDEDAWARNL